MAERRPSIRIWDLPVRLFHWALAALVIAAWITGELGRLDLHMILGELILTLVIFRLAWGLVGSPTARFATFIAGPRAALGHLRELLGWVRRRPPADAWRAHFGHTALGGWMVAAMLVALATQTGTGLFSSDEIMTDGPLNHLVSGDTAHRLGWVHWIGSWLIPALVLLHVAAAFFYLWRGRENLIGPMITGRKPVPAGSGGADQRFASPWLALALLIAALAIVRAILSL